MFSKGHYINIFSVLIIAFISGVYCFKYISIYIVRLPFLLTALYLIICFLFLISINKTKPEKLRWITKNKLFLVVSFIIICTFVYITFVPRLGAFGRLPAIKDWLNRLFSGTFPYNPSMLPSGFPVLFLLSIPFYLIKNIGYWEVLGLGIFLFLILNTSNSPRENIIKIFIVLLCPVICLEIVVRSELLANMALLILLILITENHLKEDRIDTKFFIFAVLFGLLLSTRSIVGLIYLIYLPYKFRNELLKGILFVVIIGIIFIITLIPFIIWNFNSFFKFGPFAVQSVVSFIPLWFVALIILSALFIGWVVSDIQEVLFASGIFLFVPTFVSMLHKFFVFGVYNSIVLDRFDISYLIFCIPFFILSIKEYKVYKYIGKVLA